MFVEVRCQKSILAKRFHDRNKGFFEALGQSMEENWKSEYMKQARVDFGDEYSEQIYIAWAEKSIYSTKMINIKN